MSLIYILYHGHASKWQERKTEEQTTMNELIKKAADIRFNKGKSIKNVVK